MNKSMLASYIDAIAKLPLHPSIILDTTDEQKVLQVQRLRYIAYSLFLRWFRLGEYPPDELLTTGLMHYEPFARFWDFILTLAIEVCPRSANEKIRSFESPAQVWYICLQYHSQKATESMLEGNLERKTKEKSILECFELWRQLDKIKTPFEGLMPDCLTTQLILEAREIAGREPKFDKDVYRPFIKACRRVSDYARKVSALQFGWIEANGELFMTSKHKKIPKLPKIYKK